jgi:large subunit ribosomal protein L29|tara:strand:+ start:215 stop:466 length:252 start_codon:yes stop_codon:yes gene_type:complete
MKIKEIRSMDKTTLNEKALELKKELVKVNAQVAIGTALKNPGQVREIKKTLARIITIGNEKKLEKQQKKESGENKKQEVDKTA